MREVTARNSETIRRLFQHHRVQINHQDVVAAVDRAARRTRNKLCTDFARNLRAELYGPDTRIPLEVRDTDTIAVTDPDDLILQVTARRFEPGTVLLFANSANVHTTTIVGEIGGRTILVEQHPANPQVIFKTLAMAMDEWRLGRALNPAMAATVDEVFSQPLGIVRPP
ncbi:hypothetical protein WME75_46535 [Sorangium sp. So ce1014]|uniref:hypothetical protein n=1 Tax=Sorangium sp. So ce1014 TaxID=3133326 RepID=UPI003F6339E0